MLAVKDTRAIAGLILFKFKERVSAEVIVSDNTYRDLSPNHYLFWEAIKLAYNEAYQIFDFGRTSPNNYRLMDFKKRWGTKIVDLPQYYYSRQGSKRFAETESSIGYRLMRTICKNAPAFALHRIGRFCYRHLG